MEPSSKSPVVRDWLEEVYDRTTAIRARKCVRIPFGCERDIPAGEIECWDQLTIREYTISGLCKTCQNQVFGTDDGGDEEEPPPGWHC